MHEAEEIPDVVFPSGDEAAEIVHSGEESLHLPPSSIAAAAQPASILALAPVASVGRDQLDPVLLGKFCIERI